MTDPLLGHEDPTGVGVALEGDPDGTGGYDDLVQRVVRYDLGGAMVIPVAALEDIIRSKAAADRPKDREALPILRALLGKIRDR